MKQLIIKFGNEANLLGIQKHNQEFNALFRIMWEVKKKKIHTLLDKNIQHRKDNEIVDNYVK